MSHGDLATLPTELRMALQAEMQPGESLLWAARPRPGRAAMATWFIWIFAVPWTAISLMFMGFPVASWLDLADKGTDNFSLGMSIFFFVFSLPFVGIGLVMLAAPFITLHEAKKCVYGITTQRVIKLVTGKKKQVATLAARRFGRINRIERADGSGTITIEFGHYTDSDGDKVTHKFELIAIPHVSEAMRLLERIQGEVKA